MAYNPSYYFPQPMIPQTAQPNWYYQQTTTTAQPINGLVSVTGIEGAKAYQLPPNSSMPLFDKDSDVLYLKTTDAAGYPTVRAFKFSPIEQIEAKVVDVESVTREEFEELAAKVAALSPKPRARKVANDGE